MVKVINEGQTIHRVYKDHINVKTKERTPILTKDYVFAVGKVETVPDKDFKLMINPDDFRLAKVYTKEQWADREKIITRQLELEQELLEAGNQPEKQIEIRKKMILSEGDAYLMETPLPHEV